MTDGPTTYLTVESHDDTETHALRQGAGVYSAECGAVPSFPTGKAEPTCLPCRDALGLPSAVDAAVTEAHERLGDAVKDRLQR
jgi:hypothetical protein